MSDIRVKTRFGWKDVKGNDEGSINVTGDLILLRDEKKLAASENYTAEDILSNSATDTLGTAWHFAPAPSKGIIWFGQALCTTTGLAWPLTMFLYKRVPTSEMDDNVANTGPSAADRSIYLNKIEFEAMNDLGGMSESQATPSTYGGLPIYYDLDGGHDLYGLLVTRLAETSEAAGMTMEVKLRVEPL